MNPKRIYHDFTYREAVFRICCESIDIVKQEIIRQREVLEAYIASQPEFKTSLIPIKVLPEAPSSAQQMAYAADLVGTGPMAAVAGTMAQLAAQAAIKAGDKEVIIENGGDIYLQTATPVIIGLYPGERQLSSQLGFSMEPKDTPVSVCSSSGKMGHSMSLGQCDLATVVSKDAALADAAATQAANKVKYVLDIEPTLNRICEIEGIDGILIVKDGQIGMAGHLPDLIKVK